LDALARERVDVVLMDVQMPEMDGLSATAAIRAQKGRGAQIPIVALTAHAMKGDRERCLAAGMDGYLVKPVDPEELFAVVESRGGAETAQRSDGAPDQALGRVLGATSMLTRMKRDPAVLLEIVTLYVQDSRAMLAEIRAGLEHRDGKAVERASHRLKGSLNMLGARRAGEAAYSLERMGRQDELGDGPNALVALEEEVARLERELVALTGG
jgi:CheY-like chemotaxis protein